MNARHILVVLTGIALSIQAPFVLADTVQLVNGDRLHGTVVLLNEKQLVFRSASFGELKIDRSKIDLIALGDKRLPEAQAAAVPAPHSVGAPSGPILGQVAPLLQNSAVQQQLAPLLEQLLGAGGVGDLQKNMNEARRGLQDLKKDLGPDGKALDGYINLFNTLSPQAPGTAPPKPSSPSPTISPAAPKKSPKKP